MLEKFIVGALSSGMETQLALSVANTSRIMEYQIELQQKISDAYSETAKASATAVKAAVQAQADTEETQALTSFYEGAPEIASPFAQMGARAYKFPTMSKLETESQNIQSAKNLLENSENSVLKSGPQNKMLSQLKDNELDALRHTDFTKDGVAQDPKIKAGFEQAKGLRGASLKGDPIKKGALYNDLNKKINSSEKSIQSKISNLEQTRERLANYIASTCQAGASFARGGGQLQTAAARRDQAQLDSVRSITDYATTNTKSAGDTNQQTYQNTTQLLETQIRILSDMARANGPV